MLGLLTGKDLATLEQERKTEQIIDKTPLIGGVGDHTSMKETSTEDQKRRNLQGLK